MLWRRNHTAGRWDCDPDYRSIIVPAAAAAAAAVAPAAASSVSAADQQMAAAAPPADRSGSSTPAATPHGSPGRDGRALTAANGVGGGEAELGEKEFEQRLRACMVQVSTAERQHC